MELSRSWEAANCAATEELNSILWNMKDHYPVRKSPPLVPILSQIDPVHTTTSYLSLILSTLGLPSGLFPSSFPTSILYPFVFSSLRATWPAYYIYIYTYLLIFTKTAYVWR
jgi:hypothetical protein